MGRLHETLNLSATEITRNLILEMHSSTLVYALLCEVVIANQSHVSAGKIAKKKQLVCLKELRHDT